MSRSLREHEIALAEVQQSDFRAVNLFRLVAGRIAPGATLDVGCGSGGLVAYLLEHGHDACGIDLDARTIAAAQASLERRGLDASRLAAASVESLLARGERFDNVVCMDTLEHVRDDGALFAKLVDACRPGGRLVITVPALMALYGPRDEATGHYRRYGKRELAELASGHPLRIDALHFWNVLGVLPTYVNHRLRRRPIDESFRFGERTATRRLLCRVLDGWFRVVEARLRAPLGLTLVLSATRTEDRQAAAGGARETA